MWLRALVSKRRPHRLRAGWRILLQTLLELLLYIFLIFVFFQNISSTSKQAIVFDRLIFLAATTLSIVFARHYLDRRSFSSVGLNINFWMLWDLGFGFMVAGLLMAGIYGVEFQAGWLKFMGYRWQQDSIGTLISETFASFLVLGIGPAWQEELTYRGYWFQNLREGLNLIFAILITSTAFIIHHLGNPHANYLSAFVIGLTGLWLVYAWLATEQLWLPLGIHAGWNFFEGIVFGFPVSGVDSYHWIDQTVSGPDWITGGDFGPEAGVVGIVAVGIGALLVFGWSRWRGYYTKFLQSSRLKF